MSVSPGSPSISVASMKRTSPPVPVTASPVATPGVLVRSATSDWKRWRPRYVRTSSVPTCTGGVSSPASIFAVTLRSSLPIWRSRPRTPASRVCPSMIASNGVVADADFLCFQPVSVELAADQVVARDGKLLLDRVAVELDDLHAVEQRARNGVDHVGRRNEQHVGEVEVHLQVVVAEGVVLGRVQHLEQSRRRVTPPVGADLVDLVQHDHRVHRPRLFERAGDAARATRQRRFDGGRGSRLRRGFRPARCA